MQAGINLPARIGSFMIWVLPFVWPTGSALDL